MPLPRLRPQLLLALFFGTLAILFLVLPASAARLLERSIRLHSSQPSVVTAHTLSFTIVSNGDIGSIEFEYCTNDPFIGTACSAPAGMQADLATLTVQNGETGFSVDNGLTTSNKLVITRPPVNAASQPVAYVFDNIQNPSTDKQTVFVRISTFATANATGARTDSGAVAFSTAGNLAVGGFVPPFLTMCAGVTVALDCGSATGVLVDLGELSQNTTAARTSQFSAATNDPGGYSAFILGTTLTAGNNVIPAMASTETSIAGFGQYGVNLADNGSPDVGLAVVGQGSGAPNSNYGGSDQFRFVSGEQIAAASEATDFNRYTVSYIVNISPSEKPGFYSATMTFLATAAF